jgi:hypothetical protein
MRLPQDRVPDWHRNWQAGCPSGLIESAGYGKVDFAIPGLRPSLRGLSRARACLSTDPSPAPYQRRPGCEPKVSSSESYELRSLFRLFGGGAFAQEVADALLSRNGIEDALARLEEVGYLIRAEIGDDRHGWWEATILGNALAMASFGKPTGPGATRTPTIGEAPVK